MKRPLKTAVYVRISKDSAGEGLGVERQLESCRHQAAAKDWDVDPDWTLVENDTSATTGKIRPGFERLLRGMESGHVQAVVAYKVDRLVRRLDDMVRLWEVAKQHNVLISTVAGDLDLTTPSGRANAMLWGVVANIEVENMRDRLERKAQQLLQAGKNANGGSRPFGWDLSRTSHDPVEAAIIREMADRVIKGESLTGVARDLNRRSVPTAGYRDRLARWIPEDGERPKPIRWDTRKVREVLTMERHAGRVTHKGEIVNDTNGHPVVAQWDPILDHETFDQVQAAVTGRFRLHENWSGERRHLLSGSMLRCSVCDSKVSAFQQTSGKWSYRCRTHLSRDRDQVDALVLERVRDYAMKAPIRITSWETEERADLTDEIRRLEQRLAALEDDFVTSGGDPKRLARMTSSLDSQLEALRDERMDRLSMESGFDWVEFDWDEVLTKSASLLPNDHPLKADAIEQQRNALRMYVARIVLSPTKVRGRFFDPETVDVEFRDPNRLRWTATPETRNG